jgi:hypothetical protein
MSRAKQVCGLESAQVRKEEAVTRHFRLSGVAQSLVQRAPAAESKSERYAFAAGKKTYGQKCRVISREVLRSSLEPALFCRRQVLRRSVGGIDASLRRSGFLSRQNR